MTSPFLLLNYFVGSKDYCETTKRKTDHYQSPNALEGLELLLNITFLIDPSQHALLKRLKDHIDINYVVPTEMVKSKKGKKTEQRTEEFSDLQNHRLWI